jgi:hypothetical protein
VPSADAVHCSTSHKHAQAQAVIPGRQALPIQVDSDVEEVQLNQPSERMVKVERRQEWHPTTHVVHSQTTKGLVVKLLSQTSELQDIIWESFHILIMGMLFEDAYPPYKSRTAFARTVLLAAAQNQGPSAAGIKESLKAADDEKFAMDFTDLVSLILASSCMRC